MCVPLVVSQMGDGDARHLELFLLLADFRLAGNVALAISGGYSGAIMTRAGSFERNLMGQVLFGQFHLNVWIPISGVDDIEKEIIVSVTGTENPIRSACYHVLRNMKQFHRRLSVTGTETPIRSAWHHVLRNMKQFHRRLSTALKPELSTEPCTQTWWQFAEYGFSQTLPELQAYYAVRIALHFGVDLRSQLSAAACTIYDQAPVDTDLFVEDEEHRRQNVEQLVRTVGKLERRSKLIAQFAVPLSINSYFINVLNRI